MFRRQAHTSDGLRHRSTLLSLLILIIVCVGDVSGQRSKDGGSRTREITDLYRSLDRNRNGKLEPSEYRESSLRETIVRRIESAGFDPGKPVPLDQLLKKLLRSSERGSSDDKVSPTSYRMKLAHERLPKGLPESFIEMDANHDGQVSMAEFARDWSDSIVNKFQEMDDNNDGIITPEECLAAKSNGVTLSSPPRPSSSSVASSSISRSSYSRDSSSRGSSSSRYGRSSRYGGSRSRSGYRPSSSSRSVSKEPDARETTATEQSTTPAKSSTPSAAPAEDVSDINPAYLKYAQGVIKKYDANSDGVLDKGEWEKMSKNPAAADKNGDGKITAGEYARFLTKK